MGWNDLLARFGGGSRSIGPEHDTRLELEKSDRAADRLAIVVADGMRDMPDAEVRRIVPGLYEMSGDDRLPVRPGPRWSMIAEATRRHAERFIENPLPFSPASGEERPTIAYVLPQELAGAARERAVSEAAVSWRPRDRVDYVLNAENERVSWRTGKMMAFGVEHQDNLERQARQLMERPDLAVDRFRPLEEFHVQDLPRDPAERIRWIRAGLDMEAAVVRAGLLGPRHAVEAAMTPSMDFHEEDRKPDGMGRLAPDYRVASMMGETLEGQVSLLLVTTSCRENPIPQCRLYAETDPTPHVPKPARGGLKVVGGLAMQAATMSQDC